MVKNGTTDQTVSPVSCSERWQLVSDTTVTEMEVHNLALDLE